MKKVHLRRKKHPLRVLLTPSRGRSTGTALASVGWLMVPAVCNSAKLFHVSCSRRKNLKGLIASKSSRRCRIASERTRTSTEMVRLTICPIWLLSSQNNFEKEIMNDDEEDEELSTQTSSSTLEDTTPTPAADAPTEPSPLEAPSQSA
jgi:hypothetical protein